MLCFARVWAPSPALTWNRASLVSCAVVLDLARGPTVLLSPLGTACPDIVPTVRAGKHGVFEFSNVLTGDYAVFAFDSVP